MTTYVSILRNSPGQSRMSDVMSRNVLGKESRDFVVVNLTKSNECKSSVIDYSNDSTSSNNLT